MSNLNTHYVSGEPNTTGREPFEDDSRIGTLGSGNTQHLSGGITGGQSQGLQSGAGGIGGQDVGAGQGFGSEGQGYRGVAPGAAEAHGLGGHGHSRSHDHGQHHSTGTGAGAGSAVGSAVGTGASQAIGGEGHGHHGHGHHGHSHTSSSDTVPGPGSTKPSGEGYGGIGAANTGSHVDRVGPQGQGQAAYERTGAEGPATGGAAGTDRFDTGSGGAAHGSAEGQDTSQRAPGKSSGGIGGILGTSDKDFTGRERQGGTMGAYADSDGPIEGNTSGPKGHTALTGREGNLAENPVAQAKSRGTSETTGTSTNDGVHKTHDPVGSHEAHAGKDHAGEGEKKGLMEKVKDAFTK